DGPMDAYRRGMVLNTEFPVVFMTEQEGSLPAEHRFLRLPDNLPLLALKGAENGEGFIARYLGTGRTETLSFAVPAVPADLLENAVAEAGAEQEIPPYRIATFRIPEEAMKL
ncbi:MAG: hypothetical protein IJV76_03235, partial [Clostridia bacterium]|nr:hypothetical protein [Clostridia bacterium]